MRAVLRLALGLALGSFIIFLAGSMLGPVPVRGTTPASKSGEALAKFYRLDTPSTEMLHKAEWCMVVSQTVYLWCDRLGYKGYENWVLALLVTESNLDYTAHGTAGEVGMGQVIPENAEHYGKMLKGKGFSSNTADPDWQIALAVACYGEKLKLSAGDPRLAAELYNGRGRRARHHAAKVVTNKLNIFGSDLD